MTDYLIDTYGMPSDTELRMTGCVGASRYMSHSTGKNVTPSQVKHIHGLGKLVQLNFEDSATNAKGGKAQGSKDAVFVLAGLKTLAAPKGVAVYFSVDFEVHTGQTLMATVLDYFRPIKAALHAAGYKVGAYGNADVIAALFAAGLVDFGWQTVAWSYGKRDPHAVELQDVFTQGYDKDEILHPYIGAWTPAGAQQPPTTTKPAPTPQEDDMALTPEVKAEFDGLTALIRKMFAVDVNGDGKPDFTGTDQGILGVALKPVLQRLDAIEKKLGVTP